IARVAGSLQAGGADPRRAGSSSAVYAFRNRTCGATQKCGSVRPRPLRGDVSAATSPRSTGERTVNNFQARIVSALAACAGLSAAATALAGAPACPSWDRGVGNPGAVGGSVSNAIVHDGELFVGGGFTSFEGVAAGGVARYD